MTRPGSTLFALIIQFIPAFLFLFSTHGYAEKTHDGHIHYNEDVWSLITTERAIELLEQNDIERAIVSSTPNTGTEKLYQAAPERIIPFLRPYRTFRDRYTWHSDPDIINRLEQELSSGIYRGFGEFHLFREHKDTPVIQKVMQLVKSHNLTVSAHADAETIESLTTRQPGITVIWAHCGMDHPVQDIQRLINQYNNLYCELSFREGITDENNDQISQEWKTLFETYPERFMLGMDTYTPGQWMNLPELTEIA
ncbi:MAG: hypothetical protein EP297_11285, partial [Gammaproteobacteria bacterium]